MFYTRFVEKSKNNCQAHELQVFNCKIPSTFHCAWQLILSFASTKCCKPKVVKFDILAGSEICVFKAENFKYKFQGARQRFLHLQRFPHDLWRSRKTTARHVKFTFYNVLGDLWKAPADSEFQVLHRWTVGGVLH